MSPAFLTLALLSAPEYRAHIALAPVFEESEIEKDWKDSIPYGSEDDKTCIQVFKGQFKNE